MKGPPPLRFVGLVLGGWTCARVLLLAPGWVETGKAAEPIVRPTPSPGEAEPRPGEMLARNLPVAEGRSRRIRGRTAAPPRAPAAIALLPQPGHYAALLELPKILDAAVSAHAPDGQPFTSDKQSIPLALTRSSIGGASRWSASAWAFYRRGEERQLSAGAGLLSGSQAGARVGYRLNDDPGRPFGIGARLYTPLGKTRGSEAALGLEWKPMRSIPVTFLAERRQRIGREGRSAFAVMAYGGLGERPLAGPLRLDAYAQAGVVGAKRRDSFIDGVAAVTLPAGDSGNVKLGAALWGAAQPGVSRLDIGPQISYRLPVEGGAMRISAEWRLRIAGDAVPGSGPALTLSTAF